MNLINIMRAPKLIILGILTLSLMATQCDDDILPPSCNDQTQSLSELADQIDAIIAASECNDTTECRAIAFGSKPCGGPWTYLIYSTSIDTLLLQSLVEEYNTIEDNYNSECGGVSDCAFVLPPEELACENGQCVIVN